MTLPSKSHYFFSEEPEIPFFFFWFFNKAKFIAALFTIASKWKQPKCLSNNEMNNKNMVHIHYEILFSCKKKG